MRSFDVVVVGCGAMGSAVSYNLSSRGLRVLALERFEVNHKLGSSHSKTRIIRLAYYEDQRYVPLLKRAFESWREAEKKSGMALLKMTGGLMMGDPEGELVTGVLRSAEAHSLPHRVLSARETREAYDAFSINEGYSAVFEENAGILFSEDCVRAFVRLAKETGCELKVSDPVESWTRTARGIEVQSRSGTYSSDRIVFCAGPWTSRLIGGLVPLKCERQVPFWFPSVGQACFSPERMPVFIMEEGKGHFFYGIPEVGHGVKVARTHEGEIVDPDAVNRTVTEEDVAPVRDFIAKRLPKLGRIAIDSTTCLYSNTPDLNFVVGAHPEDSRVTMVSACSGHGFKFASVLGEIVADLVIDGKTSLDIGFLSPQRFLGS